MSARSSLVRPRLAAVAAAVVLILLAVAPSAVATQPGQPAPGGPGAPADWTPANKDGFGTSTTTASHVWYTLGNGELTEVFYPNLGTPSVRDLQLVVSDDHTFAERESDATTHQVALVDPRSLTYRQIDTDKAGRFRITKTYVTDPTSNALLVNIQFQSLTGKPYSVYALYDPSLNNNGNDDSGTSGDGQLLAYDGTVASALIAQPAFGKTSTGYLGTSDGWSDLRSDYRMDWSYGSATNGNVVQMARTGINGTTSQNLVLSLGFGGSQASALATATGALSQGFDPTATAYQSGWHSYLDGLKPPPSSVAAYTTTYDVSAMVLAASEDKTYRGAYIASPTMPWAWGTGLENPSGAYHLVWARDLYEIATALIADGDRAGAERALTFLFDRQQKPDGSFPQNSTVDGTPHWTNTQMDEVADPIILAWQLGASDPGTYTHVKKAADYIVANGPSTPEERWENQGGWSPATIAAEIAGLVCAADLAQRNGDTASATTYLRYADAWQRSVQSWTATSNGPYSSSPYYLRLTKDAHPNKGTAYSVGDGGPSAIDQRAVVDPSFLELVRLGVKRADDPVIRNTIAVVDQQLGVTTPTGTFWHRYNYDGYGEKRDGSPWDVSQPDTFQTIGRIWPIFAGERGEYQLAAGTSASTRLSAMAGAANSGYLIPEQVWDNNAPSGSPGFAPGKGTFSATPLAWSHAQFIRLAWSIQASRPIERPSIVACRYTGTDC
jgi:glucoamylase